MENPRAFWMTKHFVSLTLFSTFLSTVAVAAPAANEAPTNRTPGWIHLLGPESYKPVTMYRLAHPTFAYINTDLARAEGYDAKSNRLTLNGRKQLEDDVAYAIPTVGEPESAFLMNKPITAYAPGSGGLGQNGNLGDGRSMSIMTGYRSKGGGRTGWVNPQSDINHSSGGLLLNEAVREAIWSNLLATETPYGAYRVLSILTPGTTTTSNHKDYAMRAILIAEDPHRFAHSVLNPTATELGGDYAKVDRARVDANMKTFVEALPKPARVDLRGKTRAQIFRLSMFEAIDRQAIQHGYLWAHRIFHGATSPSNASPDGRLLDFGTAFALSNYARIQVLPDDGASGETRVYKTDLFKDSRDSWMQTLPPDLRATLPTQKEMDERFDKKFRWMQEMELVRMAGTFEETFPALSRTKAAKELGHLLFDLATAGHTDIKPMWDGLEAAYAPSPYEIQQILPALANADVDSLDSLNAAIKNLVPQEQIREALINRYQSTFLRQRQLASSAGITAKAESRFRKAAATIRNKAMDMMYSDANSYHRITSALQDYERTNDPSVLQHLIDSTVRASRREYRDAAPYTVVLNETVDAKTGQRTRHIFDANANRFKRVRVDANAQSVDPKPAPRKVDLIPARSIRPASCKALFG